MNDSERRPPTGGGRPSLLGNGASQAFNPSAPGGAEPTRVLEQLGGQREHRPPFSKRGPIALAVGGVAIAACALYWGTPNQSPARAAKVQELPAPSSASPAVVAKTVDVVAAPVLPPKAESAESAARVFVADDTVPTVAKAPAVLATTHGSGSGAGAKVAPASKKAVQPARVANADKSGPSVKNKHAQAGTSTTRLARSEGARPSGATARPGDRDPDTDLIAAMLRRSDEARGNGAAGNQRSRASQ